MTNLPYTALYSAILRTFVAKMDGDALKAFTALCGYCDERGVCFPGIRQLAADTNMSIDRVYSALEALEAAGAAVCIRRDAHDAFTGLQLPNVYALHPHIVKCAQAPESAAFITLPIITKSPDRNYGIFPIHNQNHQEESESRIREPESETTTTNHKALSEEGSETPRDYAQEGQNTGKNKRKRQKASAPPARSATSVAKPSTPPTPSPPVEPSDLAVYNTPLADALYERTAQQLVQACSNISHSTARMFVDVYGVGRAAAALRLMLEQPRSSIANPTGYIRTILRRRIATEEDSPGEAADPSSEAYWTGAAP